MNMKDYLVKVETLNALRACSRAAEGVALALLGEDLEGNSASEYARKVSIYDEAAGEHKKFDIGHDGISQFFATDLDEDGNGTFVEFAISRDSADTLLTETVSNMVYGIGTFVETVTNETFSKSGDLVVGISSVERIETLVEKNEDGSTSTIVTVSSDKQDATMMIDTITTTVVGADGILISEITVNADGVPI